MTSDTALFLRQFLTNPRQVSAVAPSSRALARAITEGLGPDSGPVVEFGPGTGRLTEAILARGVPPENLTAFEMNGDFVTHLRQRFHGVHFVHAPAQQARAVLGGAVAGKVVSGLPLLSMPPTLRESIVAAAFEVLAPGGEMVQFSYGSTPALTHHQLERLGLKVRLGRRVLMNLPPARIFHYSRA